VISFAERFPDATGRSFDGVLVAILAFVGVGMAAWAAFAFLGVPEQRRREIPLDLAVVGGGTSFVRLSAREVIVMIDANGAVRTAGNELTMDEFAALLDRLSAQRGGTSVTVRADARAPYGVIARVLAASRRAGIRDASLLLVEEALAPPSR
jgi:biopolymer transport protein ExbD